MDSIDKKKPPLILILIGWFIIIVLPIAFFAFGWRDIEVRCLRSSSDASPDCHITESFAMGLYSRQVDAYTVTDIDYKTQSSRSGSARGPGSGGNVMTSTVVLATATGAVPVSRVSSNVDSNAKRELILKMRAFLRSPEVLEFHHTSNMHSVFGYLGFLGTAGLAIIFVYVVFYYLKKMMGWSEQKEK